MSNETKRDGLCKRCYAVFSLYESAESMQKVQYASGSDHIRRTAYDIQQEVIELIGLLEGQGCECMVQLELELGDPRPVIRG